MGSEMCIRDRPRIPPLSILSGFDVDVNNLSFRGEIEYTAEQNDITDFELPTDDFAFINLFATWDLPVESQDLKASISVQNLFDTDGRQHASFLKDIVPLPGRNFRFNIRAAF